MLCLKKALAVTYSCMRMHTTIGAGSFHFRVREGIGWYQTAMAAREGLGTSLIKRRPGVVTWDVNMFGLSVNVCR